MNNYQSKKHQHLKNIIAISLVLSIIIGLTSNFIDIVPLRHFFWAVSIFFVIIGASLLSSKLTREDHDIPAAGFIVLTIGQAMAYGSIATHDAGFQQHAAAVSIYVPGLILISLFGTVPLFFRIAGFIAAASFATLATIVYCDYNVEKLEPIFAATSYSPMNIALLGWAWLIYKKKV